MFNHHPDDLAVDRFAAAMKAKMKTARAKGRAGWEATPAEILWEALDSHVHKGDPVDVANFAMMIWCNSQPAADQPTARAFICQPASTAGDPECSYCQGDGKVEIDDGTGMGTFAECTCTRGHQAEADRMEHGL